MSQQATPDSLIELFIPHVYNIGQRCQICEADKRFDCWEKSIER